MKCSNESVYNIERIVCIRLAVILFASILFSPPALRAQPATEWENTYGGSNTELGNAIVQTLDGGYIVAGSTNSNDGQVSGLRSADTADVWVVKIDAGGAIEWSKTFGGSNDDGANAIIQTSDAGFALAGYTKSNDGDVSGNHGGYDVWVLKLSNLGAIEWSKTFGGTRDEKATSIVQTNDGNYAVAASTRSNDGDVTLNYGGNDFWLLKISSAGMLLWQQTYGGSGDDEPSAIVQTSDSGYALAGWTISNSGEVQGNHGSQDAWVIKTDSLGNLQWQNALGGAGEDAGSAIVETPDRGFAMTGYTSSSDGDVGFNHGGWDVWMVKLNAAGTLQWEKTYGGSQYDEAWSMTSTADGGFALAGQTNSTDGDVTGPHGGTDYWILKIANDGTLQWQDDLGGSATEEAFSIVQTTDLGFAIAGFSNSQGGDVTGNHGAEDFWVVKLAGPPCTDIRVSIPVMNVQALSGTLVAIPIVSSDTSSRFVSVLDIALKLNTNLLTPLYIDSTNGLFAASKRTRFSIAHDSVSIRLELSKPMLISAGLLCTLQCKAFVTDTLSTSVALQRVSFEDSAHNSKCLTALALTNPDSEMQFTLIPQCGERDLSLLMAKEDGLIIDAASPNPSSGKISIQIDMPRDYQNDATLEVYDALGNLLQTKPLLFSAYQQSQKISIILTGNSGVRYLRIKSRSGVSTKSVIFLH